MYSKLIITEKERMAYNIARAIGKYTTIRVNGIKAYKTEDNTVILPLRGHIKNYTTRQNLRRWTYDSVNKILNDPGSLIKTSVSWRYISAIRKLADESGEVIIATDPDEEGENIGLEVVEVLQGKDKKIKRMWLTTTLPEDIRRSLQELKEFNKNLALSVEARRKIDAITGFAGTREFTLRLGPSFKGKGVLSFGRVQTSTLWLVVKREKEIQTFVPKPYWEIVADVEGTEFMHEECPIFERERAQEIYEKVKDSNLFKCTQKKEQIQEIMPPKPLNTAEMLKAATRILRVSPSTAIKVAERLYLNGKITYPRVDNQSYTYSFNHLRNLTKLSETVFSEYVNRLIEKKLTKPTQGKKVEDHEPITPIAPLGKYDELSTRLYEIILRHYLAIFGPSAKILSKEIKGVINGEKFVASGRELKEKGFYEIFYYKPLEKKIQHDFEESKDYRVNSVRIVEKETEPPRRYTLSTLLAEMERNGIGTKSTRPIMIDILRQRGYITVKNQVVYPTERGIRFLDSIEKTLGSYITPSFTSKVESEMQKIALGQVNWEDLVEQERKNFAYVINMLRNDKLKN